VLANIHRPEDREPFTIADFMPGAAPRKTEDEEMREFIDEIQSGKKFEVPPEEMAAFKRSLASTFVTPKNDKPCSTSTASK
jgi:hypothetical protein